MKEVSNSKVKALDFFVIKPIKQAIEHIFACIKIYC